MSGARYDETLADVRGFLGRYCALGTPEFEELVDQICRAVANDAAEVADEVDVLAGSAVRNWCRRYRYRIGEDAP